MNQYDLKITHKKKAQRNILYDLHTMKFCILSTIFLVVFCVEPTFSGIRTSDSFEIQYIPYILARRCRCLSDNAQCWPSSTLWQKFNESIDGRLISPKPSAAPCNLNPSSFNSCTITPVQWHDPFWRDDQPGAMQCSNWENSSCSIYYYSSTCNQGSVPILGVKATLPEHVQTTLEFVNTHNLRLVIKNTGHDFAGRSTAYGSLLLWLHHMKNKALMSEFTTCDGEIVSNAIRLEAGVQWGEVFQWLGTYNLIAIGGASGTVGSVGGFLQGGGHGPLTRWKGLAVDQVLEYDVVLADGRRETVNACRNRDLFWALRGGGGGTFGVVLSAVLRTYPSPSVVSYYLDFVANSTSRYHEFIHHFVRLLPTIADAGWTSYFYLSNTGFQGAFFLPNGNMNMAEILKNQLTSNFQDFNITHAGPHPFPSYVDVYNGIFSWSNPTGGNLHMSSRLIPEDIVRNRANDVAQAFLQANNYSSSTLIGHLVAGGEVSTSKQNNSVNPAWRTALLHMIYTESWSDGTSNEEQQKIVKRVAERVKILQTIAGGSQSASYMNEADPNEPEWQQKFYGTMEIYNRLKAIKDTVDPNGIFVCKNCVGSDDWSDDLNCPKISSGTLLSVSILNILLLIFFFLN